MKIKLTNNQEINIKRFSKCYHPEDNRYELNMIIDSFILITYYRG